MFLHCPKIIYEMKYLFRMMLIAISPRFIDIIKKYPKNFKILGPLKNPSNTFTVI